MQRHKLEIEAQMSKISLNIKAFEKLVFDIRSDYEKVATEGYCGNCKLYFAIGLSLVEYLNQAQYSKSQMVTCPVCNEENSIKIPSFRV
jgi:hypothetical protein